MVDFAISIMYVKTKLCSIKIQLKSAEKITKSCLFFKMRADPEINLKFNSNVIDFELFVSKI